MESEADLGSRDEVVALVFYLLFGFALADAITIEAEYAGRNGLFFCGGGLWFLSGGISIDPIDNDFDGRQCCVLDSLDLGVLSWYFSSHGRVNLVADGSDCRCAHAWVSIQALGTSNDLCKSVCLGSW